MKNWIQKLTILLGAGVVYLAGQYFRGEWFVGTKLGVLCHPYVENAKVYCHSSYLDSGLALITAGEVFVIAGVLLLFANTQGLRMWWRMSAWFVPIAALLVINFPFTPFILGATTPDYEGPVQLYGLFYILFSLAVVAGTRYSEWKRHRRGSA